MVCCFHMDCKTWTFIAMNWCTGIDWTIILCWLSAKLHYTDTGYGHVVQHHQRTSSQQQYILQLDMSRCWALALRCGNFLSVGGEFVVQQVVELLWACPFVVLLEFGTKSALALQHLHLHLCSNALFVYTCTCISWVYAFSGMGWGWDTWGWGAIGVGRRKFFVGWMGRQSYDMTVVPSIPQRTSVFPPQLHPILICMGMRRGRENSYWDGMGWECTECRLESENESLWKMFSWN